MPFPKWVVVMRKYIIRIIRVIILVIILINCFFVIKIGASKACSGVVGEDGFEPSKSETTDLQSAPFGRSGTRPNIRAEQSARVELVMGLEPATC